jgi:hypothetical protein
MYQYLQQLKALFFALQEGHPRTPSNAKKARWANDEKQIEVEDKAERGCL